MIQWVSGISFVDKNLWTTLNSINYNKELTANTVVSKRATNVYLEASSPDAATEDKGGEDKLIGDS